MSAPGEVCCPICGTMQLSVETILPGRGGVSSAVPAPIPWVISTTGPTASLRYNETFVREIALEVVDALDGMLQSDVVLNAYSAPWYPDDMPHGQLTMIFSRHGRRADVGIVFGAPDEVSGMPHRCFFDEAAFAEDPMNPHAGGIIVASFDECWSIVCSILERISPRSVRFSFGA